MRKVLAVLLSAAMVFGSAVGNCGSWQTTVQAETAEKSTLDVNDFLDMSELEGYAAEEGDGLETTNGGNMGEVVVVENTVELVNAIKDDIPRVVVIKGEVVSMLSNDSMNLSSAKNIVDKSTVKSAGGYGLSVGSNKTIVGYDENAVLYGGLKINGESNVIISNLTIHGVWPYKGPGDTMEVAGSHHVWLNHLNICNSQDGNLDIKLGSDYISVSWCKFYYEDLICEWDTTTETGGTTVTYSKGDKTNVAKDHGHRLSGLVGSGAGDHDDTDMGKFHVTFHHNWFADNCNERMPRVMYGRVHIYNNYYTSSGNAYCIGVDSYASVLVENNYFKNVNNPHMFSYDDDAHAYLGACITARNNKYDNTSGKQKNGQKSDRYIQPFESTIYNYYINDAEEVPEIVTAYAGVQPSDASNPKEGTFVSGVADKKVEKADTSTPLATIAPANDAANNGQKITYDTDTKTYTYSGQNSDGSNGFYTITNPFAGKDFTETPTYKNGYPVWTKGVTIAYWVKLPTDSGSVQDAAILNFNKENDEQLFNSDKVHYEKCNSYSVEDSSYSLGTKEKYIDADGRVYTVLTGYGTNVRYNPGYPLAGYYYATDKGGAYRVYKEGTDPSDESNWTYLDYIGRGYYAEYAYKDYESEEYGKGSKIQYALTSGSFSLYGSGSMGYREDNNSDNCLQRNPYLINYSNPISIHKLNQFYYWANGSTKTNASGKMSPIMSDTSSNWHYVVTVITNDWVQTYIDGTELTTDYLNYWSMAFNVENAAKGFNWGYGMSKLYRTNSPSESYRGDTLLLDFISDEDTTLMIGGLGAGATYLSQHAIKTPDGTQVKNLEFYDVPLTAAQISSDKVTLPTDYTEAPEKKEDSQTTKYPVIPDSELDVPISNPNQTAFSGRLYIAGDSIADGLDYEGYTGDVVGWGDVIGSKYTSDVTVINEAKYGDSTKSYYYDYDNDGNGDGHRYKAVYDNIAENDYVIISFGHNDGPANRNDVPVGVDTAEKRASDTEGTFQWYLKQKFIQPALDKGAVPILMTPVVRCMYDSTGTFKEETYHLEYAQAMRDLADELAEEGITIPLIDAQLYTYNTYSKLTQSEAEAYHATNDVTHYNQAGAEWISEFVVAALNKYNLEINDYAKKKPSVVVPTISPSASPEPSAAPSTKPSTTPGTKPSTAPSTKPSTTPGTKPSAAPSATPSAKPTIDPGSAPDIKTSAAPDTTPEVEESKNPSVNPSMKPAESDILDNTTTPGVSQSPSASYRLGDLDNNGQVELQDAQKALRAALRIDMLNEMQSKAADVDKNGQVELADAQLILKRALQIITKFDKE